MRRNTLALLLGLVTAAARAAPIYPVSAGLSLAPPEQQRCLKSTATDRGDCNVIARAREAFQVVVARMFIAAPRPALRLILAVTDADLYYGASGIPEIYLRTRVRILTADGVALDEIATDGRASFIEASAADAAAQDAAGQAARAFEVGYGRSTPVRDWLVAAHLAAPEAVSLPARSDRLVSASAGGNLVQGVGDGDVAPAVSFRVAASLGRAMVQLLYSRYSSSFQGVGPNFNGVTSPALLDVNDLGLEAGAVFPLRNEFEVRAGPGLHLLLASGALEHDVAASSSTKLSPSVFASLSKTFLPFRSGARFIAAVEARAFFFSTVAMGAAGRTVPAANTSFGLNLGVEFPWGDRTTP